MGVRNLLPSRQARWLVWAIAEVSDLFRKTELDLLLSERHSPKRPFPEARKPALVAAMNHLTRKAQRNVLGDLPGFRAYLITDHVFHEAARQAPRPRGRPRRPSSD